MIVFCKEMLMEEGWVLFDQAAIAQEDEMFLDFVKEHGISSEIKIPPSRGTTMLKKMYDSFRPRGKTEALFSFRLSDLVVLASFLKERGESDVDLLGSFPLDALSFITEADMDELKKRFGILGIRAYMLVA